MSTKIIILTLPYQRYSLFFPGDIGWLGMSAIISGIQQVGIGVTDLHASWNWYREQFGMDVPIFNDSAEATFMSDYTGKVVHSRAAVLAINMRGGGGFEIWQFTSRTPERCSFQVMTGDLGVTAIVLKTTDAASLFDLHRRAGIVESVAMQTNPNGTLSYYVRDPDGNLFRIVESGNSFSRTRHQCGGVSGVEVGVRNVEEALPLYSEVLGYNDVVYDCEGVFADLAGAEGEKRYRRILLRQANPARGSFGRLFGPSTIELYSCLDREPREIYENRFWGDCGFIHVCFDVRQMDELKSASETAGFEFTVDSGGSFDMGKAKGRFAYTEDPDGTLIEFVETFKMPILERLNLYLNLEHRNPEKPLPDWMLKTLKFSRVR